MVCCCCNLHHCIFQAKISLFLPQQHSASCLCPTASDLTNRCVQSVKVHAATRALTLQVLRHNSHSLNSTSLLLFKKFLTPSAAQFMHYAQLTYKHAIFILFAITRLVTWNKFTDAFRAAEMEVEATS